MRYYDYSNFDGHDQPPLPLDFPEFEPWEPDFDDLLGESRCRGWPLDNVDLARSKPQTLGIHGGWGFECLTLDEVRSIIPRELQIRRSWCVWIYEYHSESQRWRKRPYLPFHGAKTGFFPASAIKPRNSATIDRILDAFVANWPCPLDGVGRFFSADDTFSGIDLDHCFDEAGRPLPWAADVLAMFIGAYVELSPSGTGLKLWTRGKLPGPGLKQGGFGPDGTGAVEIYDRDRYFTMTARPYGEQVQGIADGSAAVLTLYARLGGIKKIKSEKSGGRVSAVSYAAVGVESPRMSVLSDEQVITKARRAYPEFGNLYDSGDLSQHDGDWSRADSALLKQIAFFAGGDQEQILRIFDGSALARREKWATRPDYRDATIAAVLSRMMKYYDPGHRIASPAAARGSSQWGGG